MLILLRNVLGNKFIEILSVFQIQKFPAELVGDDSSDTVDGGNGPFTSASTETLKVQPKTHPQPSASGKWCFEMSSINKMR